jgi:hypothetical protein
LERIFPVQNLAEASEPILSRRHDPFFICVNDRCEFAGISNCHIQMFGQRIVDVVVVAGCLNRSFGSSISLCEVIEVRVLDANLFNISPGSSITATCTYCLCASLPRYMGYHSKRRCVKQGFTYSDFPDCRGGRQSGYNAYDSASYALEPIS